jgi:hypothetical protein
MVDEGLVIVAAVRSRYDGHTRNPWNEYECGNYYARAMSSYALLIAISGFHYSAVTHTLTIAPRLDTEPFTCFFSTASGWGTFTVRADRLEVRLAIGELQVDKLQVTSHGRTILMHPSITIRAGKTTSVILSGEK